MQCAGVSFETDCKDIKNFILGKKISIFCEIFQPLWFWAGSGWSWFVLGLVLFVPGLVLVCFRACPGLVLGIESSYPTIHLLPGSNETILVVRAQQMNVQIAMKGIDTGVGRWRVCIETTDQKWSQKMCIRYIP